MGFFDRLVNQFIEIIQWSDAGRDTLVFEFPVYAKEIKNGAQLVVLPGQAAVLVNQGKIADVYGPGQHTLTTANMPILSTLMGWKYGFESPFKAQVFFVSTTNQLDMKWGTPNPIMMRDPEFGPVRIRAFGTYTFAVTDPAKLIYSVVGSNPVFSVDQIAEQLRNTIVARFADFLAEAKVPVMQVASQQDEIAARGRERVQKDFEEYGVSITKFLISNVSLPPEVEAILDKRTSMNIMGDMGQFQQFQQANAIEAAAKNPGAAGAGMGMLVGANLAQGLVQPAAAPQAPARPAAGVPVAAVAGAFCPSCGAQQAPGSRFCAGCGKPTAPQVVACACGAQLASGAKFCASCGKPVA